MIENEQIKTSWAFSKFLEDIEKLDELPTNVTSTGSITIQQTPRNLMRREGIKAFKADLQALYGDKFDVVETREGIVIVAEGRDFTFSWEVKPTIKNLDYDPFIEANNYEEDQAQKATKRLAKERAAAEHAEKLAAKREAKLNEIEAKRGLINE